MNINKIEVLEWTEQGFGGTNDGKTHGVYLYNNSDNDCVEEAWWFKTQHERLQLIQELINA